MKKIPTRKCIGCDTIKPKNELIRIVKTNVGDISIDKTGKKAGRGAYICDEIKCLELAIKKNKLEREFEQKIEEEIYNLLRGVIIDSAK